MMTEYLMILQVDQMHIQFTPHQTRADTCSTHLLTYKNSRSYTLNKGWWAPLLLLTSMVRSQLGVGNSLPYSQKYSIYRDYNSLQILPLWKACIGDLPTSTLSSWFLWWAPSGVNQRWHVADIPLDVGLPAAVDQNNQNITNIVPCIPRKPVPVFLGHHPSRCII